MRRRASGGGGLAVAALLALAGCLSAPGGTGPTPPPADAWSFGGAGSASVAGPGQDSVAVTVSLPTEGAPCKYRATVRTTHRDPANYTLSLSGMFLDSHAAPAEPQVLPGSLLVAADSLARPAVGLSAGGLHVERRVDLPAGATDGPFVDEVSFAGDLVASPDFHAGFGLRPVAQPVLVLFVASHAPPGTQDVALELAWTDCEVAWALGALDDRVAVRAESFRGTASAVVGLPWLARDAAWSGGLDGTSPVRLWAARCPGGAAAPGCSMTVTPEGGAPLAVASVEVEATRAASRWTVAVEEAGTAVEGGYVVFFAAGIAPARLDL